MLSRFSSLWLFSTSRSIARQVSLSMGFSKQGCWSGLSCPPPEDWICISYASYIAGRFFTTSTTWEDLKLSFAKITPKWVQVSLSSVSLLHQFNFICIHHSSEYRMTTHSDFPRTVPVSACCSVVCLTIIPSHSQKCPGLESKLCSPFITRHILYRPSAKLALANFKMGKFSTIVFKFEYFGICCLVPSELDLIMLLCNHWVIRCNIVLSLLLIERGIVKRFTEMQSLVTFWKCKHILIKVGLFIMQ